MIKVMNVRELVARLEKLIAEGLDLDVPVTVRFRDVDADCFVGGALSLDVETGCGEDPGLVIDASNDPEDFEETDPATVVPSVVVRSLRLVPNV
jgi:hypothetical protein